MSLLKSIFGNIVSVRAWLANHSKDRCFSVDDLFALTTVEARKLGYQLVSGILEMNQGYSLINLETRNRTDYRTLDSVLSYLEARSRQLKLEKNY